MASWATPSLPWPSVRSFKYLPYVASAEVQTDAFKTHVATMTYLQNMTLNKVELNYKKTELQTIELSKEPMIWNDFC